MTFIPYNPKAGYDMTLFGDSKASQTEAAERLKVLNKQGPRGWQLIPLEG